MITHNLVHTTQDENPSQKISDIRTALLAYLNSQCLCNLNSSYVTNEELSCRQGLQDQISYRARIFGTNTYSAGGLVQLLQAWVGTGTASIRVGVSRLEADPSCPVFLDNLNAPDCLPTPHTSTPPTVDTIVGGISGGEIGGIIVGLLIAVLLVVLAVLLVVHIWRSWNSKKIK